MPPDTTPPSEPHNTDSTEAATPEVLAGDDSESSEITLSDIWSDAQSAIASGKSFEIAANKNFQLESEAKKLSLDLYGKRQFLGLQKDWASHIRWQIWAVLAFQFAFVLLVGFNPWGFTDNLNKMPYMYIGVILQTLANIVALGFVVAKFLFPNGKDSKKS